MAGCIVGECDHCGWPVDETDWSEQILMTKDVFVHTWCRSQYMSKGQRAQRTIDRLMKENAALRKALDNKTK